MLYLRALFLLLASLSLTTLGCMAPTGPGDGSRDLQARSSWDSVNGQDLPVARLELVHRTGDGSETRRQTICNVIPVVQGEKRHLLTSSSCLAGQFQKGGSGGRSSLSLGLATGQSLEVAHPASRQSINVTGIVHSLPGSTAGDSLAASAVEAWQAALADDPSARVPPGLWAVYASDLALVLHQSDADIESWPVAQLPGEQPATKGSALFQTEASDTRKLRVFGTPYKPVGWAVTVATVENGEAPLPGALFAAVGEAGGRPSYTLLGVAGMYDRTRLEIPLSSTYSSGATRPPLLDG